MRANDHLTVVVLFAARVSVCVDDDAKMPDVALQVSA